MAGPRIPPPRITPRMRPPIAPPRTDTRPADPTPRPTVDVHIRPEIPRAIAQALAADPRSKADHAIPRELPTADTVDSKLWILRALEAHATLRSRSTWDTGVLIGRLLDMRATIGARDIKDLVEKVPELGMSHMTANKYLLVSRVFTRDEASEHRIEKCYALIRYAKFHGRGEAAAAEILRTNAAIVGAPGKTAETVTAHELKQAIDAIKKRRAIAAIPPERRQLELDVSDVTEKLFRDMGLKRASTAVVTRDGERQIAIYIPLVLAQQLEAVLPRGIAKLAPKLAKKSAAAYDVLRANGWKLSGVAPPPS